MTTKPSPKVESSEWSEERRKALHSIFNEWMATCPAEDYQQLMELRERIAPGQVCSIVSLIRSCFARSDWLADVPQSLLQLMRARNWLQPSVASTSSAG